MGTNYYVQTPACANACEHCAKSERVHLGKSSVGWKFLHRAHGDWTPAEAHQRWLELAATGPITDEYGDVIELDELLEFIQAKAEKHTQHRSLSDGYGYFRAEGGHDFCNREFI